MFNHKSSKWVPAVPEDLGEAEAAAKKLASSPTSSPNEKKKSPSPKKAGADGRMSPPPVPSSTVVENLLEGRAYKFRVTSSNKWGESEPSAFSEEVYLEPPCPEGYEHHRIPAERAPEGKEVEWWVCLRTGEKLWERPTTHDKYAITPQLARLFTEEDILGFLDDFKAVDVDGGGGISNHELAMLLTNMDEKFSNKYLMKLVAEADADGSGEIEFGEFIQVMYRVRKAARPLWKKAADGIGWGLKKVVKAFENPERKARKLAAYEKEKFGPWRLVEDENIKKSYYQNVETQHVQWDMPERIRWYVPERLKKEFSGPELQDFMRKFMSFDLDGSGAIDEHELTAIMTAIADAEDEDPPTEETIRQTIDEVDENGNGLIEFDEFCQVMLNIRRGGESMFGDLVEEGLSVPGLAALGKMFGRKKVEVKVEETPEERLARNEKRLASLIVSCASERRKAAALNTDLRRLRRAARTPPLDEFLAGERLGEYAPALAGVGLDTSAKLCLAAARAARRQRKRIINFRKKIKRRARRAARAVRLAEEAKRKQSRWKKRKKDEDDVSELGSDESSDEEDEAQDGGAGGAGGEAKERKEKDAVEIPATEDLDLLRSDLGRLLGEETGMKLGHRRRLVSALLAVVENPIDEEIDEGTEIATPGEDANKAGGADDADGATAEGPADGGEEKTAEGAGDAAEAEGDGGDKHDDEEGAEDAENEAAGEGGISFLDQEELKFVAHVAQVNKDIALNEQRLHVLRAANRQRRGALHKLREAAELLPSFRPFMEAHRLGRFVHGLRNAGVGTCAALFAILCMPTAPIGTDAHEEEEEDDAVTTRAKADARVAGNVDLGLQALAVPHDINIVEIGMSNAEVLEQGVGLKLGHRRKLQQAFTMFVHREREGGSLDDDDRSSPRSNPAQEW